MRSHTSVCLLLAAFSLARTAYPQFVGLRSAPTVDMPSRADSNSPAYWRDGELFTIHSTGNPLLSRGGDQYSQHGAGEIQVDSQDHFPMWIESAWQDSDGTLYAWYHHEPGGVCGGGKLTAPKIGALVSYDGGASFSDLGIVLESGDAPDCSAENGFFAGGHGDFSVILDRDGRYFYFLFDNYGGDPAGQGVAIARMAAEDRSNPAGAVWKYYEGGWGEPGLGGPVTPVFPVAASWQRADTDAFWGPSVHWNTYLESYVVLLNHSCCRSNWPQEGIYITFNADLGNPTGWSSPSAILSGPDSGPGYYPQVLGSGPGESDTLAGEVARLYVMGHSKWEIVFVPAQFTDPPPIDPVGSLDQNGVNVAVPRRGPR